MMEEEEEIRRRRDWADLPRQLVEIIWDYSRVARSVSLRACCRIVLFPATARLADKDLAVLAIDKEGRLGYWRRGDKSWTPLDDKIYHYDDLVVRNGQYYVLDRAGRVSWIDGNLGVVQYSPPLYGFRSRKSLVESRGELYVVERDMDFRVYRLDEEWGRWEKVKSLGDRSFVLGADCSFSFDAMELFGGKGNCIYFTDDDDDERCQLGKPTSCDSVGVFRLEDGSIEKLGLLPEYWNPRKDFGISKKDK